MHDYDVVAFRLYAIQDRLQMVKRMIIAYRNQNVAGAHANALRREIFLRSHVELVHFNMRSPAIPVRDALGNRKDAEHND